MKERGLKILTFCAAMIILLIIAGIVYTLLTESAAAFRHLGFSKLIAISDWDSRESNEQYGILGVIAGTILTATLALLISIPFSLALALFCKEFYKGENHRYWLNIMASVPSIIFGIWGYYVICPLVASLGINPYGYGVFTATLVLAIMIVPYSTLLITICLAKTPQHLKDAAYSIGASRFEVVMKVILPYARNGICAAYMLSFGKLLAETMVVAMLIGNSYQMPTSLADVGGTMTGLILNQYGTANDLKLSVIFAVALILFLMSAGCSIAARKIIGRITM